MLQICVIRTYDDSNVIFNITFLFSKIFLYNQKLTFMNNIISFRRKEHFTFESN